MAAKSQVFFSFLSAFRAYELILEGCNCWLPWHSCLLIWSFPPSPAEPFFHTFLPNVSPLCPFCSSKVIILQGPAQVIFSPLTFQNNQPLPPWASAAQTVCRTQSIQGWQLWVFWSFLTTKSAHHLPSEGEHCFSCLLPHLCPAVLEAWETKGAEYWTGYQEAAPMIGQPVIRPETQFSHQWNVASEWGQWFTNSKNLFFFFFKAVEPFCATGISTLMCKPNERGALWVKQRWDPQPPPSPHWLCDSTLVKGLPADLWHLLMLYMPSDFETLTISQLVWFLPGLSCCHVEMFCSMALCPAISGHSILFCPLHTEPPGWAAGMLRSPSWGGRPLHLGRADELSWCLPWNSGLPGEEEVAWDPRS